MTSNNSTNSPLQDPVFTTNSILSHLTPLQQDSTSTTTPKLESNLSLDASLQLPSPYTKSQSKALRKAAFRTNRKILKRYKRERKDEWKRHKQMVLEQQQQGNTAAVLPPPLPPVDVESDPQLYHAFVMVPNQYLTLQEQKNSLVTHASTIEPGTTFVEMPDVKELDVERKDSWLVPEIKKIRDEWIEERKQIILSHGEVDA